MGTEPSSPSGELLTESTEVWAFGLLLQRFHNEDRNLGERTNVLLLANAFLFVGFVALERADNETLILDLAVPIIELCLTLIASYLNLLSVRAQHYFVTRLSRIWDNGADF